MKVLEQRNHEGKTAFLLATELNHSEIAKELAEKYPKLNLFARDTKNGDTALHMACRNRDLNLVQHLFEVDPDKCLYQNYYGQTPVYLATKAEDMRILELFAEYKWRAL